MSKILDVTCVVAEVFGAVVIGMYVCGYFAAIPLINICGMILTSVAIVCLAALAVLAALSAVCYCKTFICKTK
jgi:tellurite resistance protein TehA-like permease